MAKKVEYYSQGLPTMIRATSRVSVKLNDSFYTFEYSEERAFPIELVLGNEINFEREKELLWEDAHAQVDKQISDIVALLKNK